MARMPAQRAHGCAWITGASSGIGAALARELAGRGWAVAATARNAEALERLAQDNRAIHAFAADVSNRDDMQAAAAAIVAKLGPIGLVVANAGVYIPVDARAPDAAAYRKTFDVNLMGVVHAIEAVSADMVARRQGHIHIVSSATGFGGMPTSSAYGASKAALINMAECLKIELDRCGVGVSISTPGFVETPAQTDNAFPKPAMITPEIAARRIADAVERGGFETTFPRRFTWLLKALYALPKPLHLPLVRAQTGWGSPDKEPPRPTKS
ncbi:MAG: SDR family NAD(P)-dependent oxidoreductase [Alphaproteobacteria bacterium]|nr:SDR family NAD(P)-dependent oxidoreductase [Alphaproteobacteria bacterium]